MSELAALVGEVLKSHGLMLVTAESCTGGGIAQAITEVAGSSAWFERGFVTYSNLSKQQLLGVRETTLNQHGAVSEMTVREMAAGALDNSAAQVAVAVSGVAGPSGGTPEKPVGTVWCAWGLKNGYIVTSMHLFNGNRAEVRQQAVQIALQGVVTLLNGLTKIA